MSTVICTNVETCPRCGRHPDEWERFWRLLSLNCECGKSYGARGLLPGTGPDSSIPVIKATFRQWNDGARAEKGLPKVRSRFRIIQGE